MKFRFFFVLPLVILAFVLVGSVSYLSENTIKKAVVAKDEYFGWKFPIAKFPLTGSDGSLIAYSTIRDPGGIPEGLPVRLKIPIIGVDSVIEDALITPDGRMDVPEGSKNVAWFSPGPHPGNKGSAVIGGHFGISNGVPWVFYNLDKLKVGDKIYVVNDKDETLAFVVRAIKSYDRNADATPVFTSQDGLAHLNLITCEGVWNQVNGTYPLRLVVFTDAISGEGSVEVNEKEAEAAKTKEVTKATVVPKQKRMSLPQTSQQVASGDERSPSFQQLLVDSAHSLYETPFDVFITVVLLGGIGFMMFKIIKRRKKL